MTTWLAKYSDGKIINALEIKHHEAVSHRNQAEDKQKLLQQSANLLEEKVSILHEEYQALQKRNPGWLQRLFNRKHYQSFLQQLEAKNLELINERKKKTGCTRATECGRKSFVAMY
ncbi:hypothetical protein LD112_17035 [Pantoea agglomerans]|nr:hypothetical protein [Pantoea agglomerans]